MDDMSVNQRLRSIRRAKGLTLEELADLTGTQGSYFGRIERGERGLSPKMAQRLAPALGVEAEFLLMGHRRVLVPVELSEHRMPETQPGAGTGAIDRSLIETVTEYVLHTYAREYGNSIPTAEIGEIARSVAVFCWAYRLPESRSDIEAMRDSIANAVAYYRQMQPKSNTTT